MKNLPNFLVIGPPKCASTSLHFYLGQHPEIFMSKVKETNFFTHDYLKGISYYASFFSEAGEAKAIGEATPAYFFLPFVADRIKKELPGIKFIVLVRNPIERAFSNWLMLWEAGIEKLNFREAVEMNVRQMKYVNFENEKGAKLYDDRRYMTDPGEKWPRTYIQPGMFAKNLAMYYNRFSTGQIKIIYLSDLKNNFNETMSSIFIFLEINENFIVNKTEEKNFYFNKKYFRLLQKMIGIKAAKGISKKMPGNIKNIFKQDKSAVKNKPIISEEDYKFLYEIYQSDIKQMELLTGKNLSHWKLYPHKNI